MRTLLRRLRCMSLLDPAPILSCAPAPRLSHAAGSLAVREHRRPRAASGGGSHACLGSRDGERGLARRAEQVGHRGAASGFRAPAEHSVLFTAQGSNARVQPARATAMADVLETRCPRLAATPGWATSVTLIPAYRPDSRGCPLRRRPGASRPPGPPPPASRQFPLLPCHVRCPPRRVLTATAPRL